MEQSQDRNDQEGNRYPGSNPRAQRGGPSCFLDHHVALRAPRGVVTSLPLVIRRLHSSRGNFITGIVLLLSLILALFLDLPIAVFAETLSPYKPVAEAISLLGHAIPWLVLVITMMVIFRQTLLRAGLAILMVYGITGLIVAVVKLGFGRYRPGMWFSSELYGIKPLALSYQDCSFPSGHSQTIFAFMVAFAFVFPKGKYYFWAIAGTVALSRIVVNYHYASDVLIGSYIGIVGAILIMKALLPQQHKAG